MVIQIPGLSRSSSKRKWPGLVPSGILSSTVLNHELLIGLRFHSSPVLASTPPLHSHPHPTQAPDKNKPVGRPSIQEMPKFYHSLVCTFFPKHCKLSDFVGNILRRIGEQRKNKGVWENRLCAYLSLTASWGCCSFWWRDGGERQLLSSVTGSPLGCL